MVLMLLLRLLWNIDDHFQNKIIEGDLFMQLFKNLKINE